MTRIRAWLRLKMGWIPRPVRQAIVGVIGGTLLLLAVVGMVLPIMPGVIFLPFGLAILAVEFAWAARWLKSVKKTAANVQQRVRNGMGRGRAEAPLAPATPIAPEAESAASQPSSGACIAANVPLPGCHDAPRNAAA
jgi:hypothetical protein